jgi:hypothetical protein
MKNKKLTFYPFLFLAFVVSVFFIFHGAKYLNQPKNIPGAGKTFSKADNQAAPPRDFAILWWSDFNHNRIVGFNPQGQVVWMQNMSAPPIPKSSWYYIGGVERVTVAPNGNLITSYGDAMIVEELDRKTHEQVWQYGITGLQTYRGGFLDEPHKSFKINDHEVLINDSNDREVIVVDQNTNQIVWQYGEYHQMSTAPGLLMGNTSATPVDGGKEFLITDTLQKKIILVDRATKNILWQWEKPDSEWLENIFVTKDNNFVLADRLNGDVFEVNRDGKILWDLTKLADENKIIYPTDAAMLENGDVVIAEAGKSRIVEVVPATGQIVRQYLVHGFVSTIALDYNGLDSPDSSAPASTLQNNSSTAENSNTFTVNDIAKDAAYSPAPAGGEEISGKVTSVNASTGRAGAFSLKSDGTNYGVEVYNYSRVIGKSGATLSLDALQKGDNISVTGTISGTYIRASLVKDSSR